MTDQKITVAVVGLGFLGRGIATCVLGHGMHVIGYGRSANALAFAREHIARGIDELVELGGFDLALQDEWQLRYLETQNLADCENCDFVIESVAEDLQVKRSVYAELERAVSLQTPIASNTSSIPVTLLQQGLSHPERFLGMHWAEPAHATRFLEIVRGEKTDQQTVDRTLELARKCGKEPSVLSHDIPGFIVNRLAYAIYREAAHLVEQGIADVETVDRSFRNACGLWATMCGPFRWIDLTGGPALYAKAMERVLPTLSNATEVPSLFDDLAKRDARGIANGEGFYRWSSEDAAQAEALFRKHAWNVHRLMNDYFSSPEDGRDASD